MSLISGAMSLNGARGNIYFRDHAITTTKLGLVIKRDVHNFHHETAWMWGWWLVIGDTPDGRRLITQNAAKTYRREIWERVPYYYPDRNLLDDNTYIFIGHNEVVPEGAEEIPYKPFGYHCTIHKEVKHSFIALGLDSRFGLEPGAEGVCIYSHRNPQDGDIMEDFNGWGGAYV